MCGNPTPCPRCSTFFVVVYILCEIFVSPERVADLIRPGGACVVCFPFNLVCCLHDPQVFGGNLCVLFVVFLGGVYARSHQRSIGAMDRSGRATCVHQ